MKRTVIFSIISAFMLISFSSNAQILTPVKWKFYTKQISKEVVELKAEATIDKGWHLYGQYFEEGGPLRTEFKFNESVKYQKNGKVLEYPKPHVKMDDIFEMEVQYFTKKVIFTQKIKVLSESNFAITGLVSAQACTDTDGRCVFADSDFDFKVKGVEKKNEQKTEKTENKLIPPINDTSTSDTGSGGADSIKIIDKTEKETVKKNIRSKTTPILVKNNPWSNDSDEEQKSLIWFFFLAMLFGFTALVTPCVFPMIPMTVSFFMPAKDEKKRKSRMKALIFGISIVVIYTLPIAIVIAISNFGGNDSVSSNFANFLSTHWIPNIFFFLIFVVFAASFFGMFEIVLPNWIISKSDKQADKGGLVGIFFMAFTLVLVSFSCTGPIVGGILVESTQGGQVLKPIIGMMGFSLGVAIPFALFAYFPNLLKKLPQSGGWLNSVKVVLGFIELALGFKFLSVADQTYHWGLLDREIYIAIWIVIFTLMGLYLLGKIKFAHDSEVKHIKVPRLALVILTFTFVIYLIPGMFGAPLKFLSGYLPPQSTHDFNLVKMIRGETEPSICSTPKHKDELHLPHGLHGYYDYYQALECSKEQNKPIFIDFTGHGCVNCREMEANVWSDPAVLKILKEDYIILALYVDDKKIEIPKNEWFKSTYDKKIKKTLGQQNADIQIVNFNKNSQPYYVLLDFSGNVLAEPRAYDLDTKEFLDFLKKGKTEFARYNGLKH